MTRLMENLEADNGSITYKNIILNKPDRSRATNFDDTYDTKSTMLHLLTLLIECKGTPSIDLKTSKPNL